MNLENILKKCKKIKLLILDVDGVLTDGNIFFDNNGHEIKRFNSLDGHGIRMLIKNNIEVAIITARSSNAVKCRMDNLGIKHLYQNQSNKVVVFKKLISALDIKASEVGYIGDDVLDLPVLLKVGLPVAVKNSHDFIKKHCVYITKNKGGHGAVREIVDIILKAQDKFNITYNKYLK